MRHTYRAVDGRVLGIRAGRDILVADEDGNLSDGARLHSAEDGRGSEQ